MEWYNILTLIVGALGGTAGVVGIYKARPEKEGIVVKNMREMLDEAHRLYDEMKSERNAIRDEFDEYKDATDKRFEKLEAEQDNTKEMVTHLKGVINRGYGCRYPDNPSDCPVVKEYEKMHFCGACNEK